MTYAIPDSLLAALADPTRRSLYERIARRPSSVGELAKGGSVSRPAVSQHLKVLNDAGLLTVRAEGTRRIYSVRPDGLADLRRWLDGFWDQALHNLENEIKTMKGAPHD